MCLELIALVFGVIAAVVIVWMATVSIVRRGTTLFCFRAMDVKRLKQEFEIQLYLGQQIAIALSLLIAAEILVSIVAPSLNKLYVVALTVAIRVIVGFAVRAEEARARQLTAKG